MPTRGKAFPRHLKMATMRDLPAVRCMCIVRNLGLDVVNAKGGELPFGAGAKATLAQCGSGHSPGSQGGTGLNDPMGGERTCGGAASCLQKQVIAAHRASRGETVVFRGVSGRGVAVRRASIK